MLAQTPAHYVHTPISGFLGPEIPCAGIRRFCDVVSSCRPLPPHPNYSKSRPLHLRRDPGSFLVPANRKHGYIPPRIIPYRPWLGCIGNAKVRSLPPVHAPSERPSRQSHSPPRIRSDRKTPAPSLPLLARRKASSPRNNPCRAPSSP